MVHTCPECGSHCTCNGDWDDIDYGDDPDCGHCSKGVIDVLVTNTELDCILPLGKRGCEKCDGEAYYCDDCTENLHNLSYALKLADASLGLYKHAIT